MAKKKNLECVIGEIEGGFHQKFVVGLRKGKLTYVAKQVCGESPYHADIAAEYSVRAIGGGWVYSTPDAKIVEFGGTSGSFGGVPDCILKQFKLEDAYREKYGANKFFYNLEGGQENVWTKYKRDEK